MRTSFCGCLAFVLSLWLTSSSDGSEPTNYRRTRHASVVQAAEVDSATQVQEGEEPEGANQEPMLLEEPYGLSSPSFPGYVSGFSYQLHPTAYRVRWTERQPPRPGYFRTCPYYRGGRVVPGSPLARACGHCQPPVWQPLLVPPPPSCGHGCRCHHHR